MGVTVARLSKAIGAEIKGVDLSRPLDTHTLETVRAAWLEHIVLLFRGQDFSPDDQLRFAGYLGKVAQRKMPEDYHIPKETYDNPGIHFISNVRDEDGELIGVIPDGEMWMHHDTSYKKVPDRATMLYSMEAPAHGGHTRWANMYTAWETLPDELKSALEGRRALNVYDYALTERVDLEHGLDEVEHAWHPAVIIHPGSGRKALFVSRMMTCLLDGMDQETSQRILSRVFDHADQEKFTYVHPWVPGDFVLWDNLACTHGRTDFPPTERRLLRRCKVAGVPSQID